MAMSTIHLLCMRSNGRVLGAGDKETEGVQFDGSFQNVGSIARRESGQCCQLLFTTMGATHTNK